MAAKKVVVGMSGGVDSSVAAYLLKKEGYEVAGATMRVWGGESEDEDAARVANILGIKHYSVDYSGVFKEKVVDCFVDEYLHARTPNPCVSCNRYVKWEALLSVAKGIGADFIATGHYAKVEKLESGRFAISSSASGKKDQSYVLYKLTQGQLSHTLMPLGGYTKPQIREIAKKLELPVAEKADSQEICFIPSGDHVSFIKEYSGVSMPKGSFVTENGEVLGAHKGLYHYTIGQRRGLGLPMGRRVFVKAIDAEKNVVVVAEDKDMFTDRVKMNALSFMGLADLPYGKEERFIGKIRYGHAGTPCIARRSGIDEISCYYDEPVRAPAPGQSQVLYKDGYVAIGGIISAS